MLLLESLCGQRSLCPAHTLGCGGPAILDVEWREAAAHGLTSMLRFKICDCLTKKKKCCLHVCPRERAGSSLLVYSPSMAQPCQGWLAAQSSSGTWVVVRSPWHVSLLLLGLASGQQESAEGRPQSRHTLTKPLQTPFAPEHQSHKCGLASNT